MEHILLKVSIMLVPALMAITCHEVSHGFVADKLGDNTARSMGRLTLNPIKHIDIFGTLMVFIVGIGWAKPVPVNFNRLRRPRTDMMLVAAAGPITNFVLAFISGIALRILISTTAGLPESSPLAAFVDPITLMLAFSVYINFLLAIFNLIPIPPLDGGRVAVGLLPLRLSMALAKVEPFGFIIVIALVFFTDLFSYVISPALTWAIHMTAGGHSDLVFRVTSLMMR